MYIMATGSNIRRSRQFTSIAKLAFVCAFLGFPKASFLYGDNALIHYKSFCDVRLIYRFIIVFIFVIFKYLMIDVLNFYTIEKSKGFLINRNN